MTPFARSCSTGAPLSVALVDEADGHELERRELFEPFLVVGRHEASDWRLNHPAISRRHAYLQVLGGRLAFFDLESRTGVRLGDRTRRSGWIKPGESIGLGPFRLQNLGVDRDGLIALPALRAEPADRFTLEFLDAPEPVVWPMTVPIALIGRSAACHLRLPDDEVSQIHCSLVQNPAGLWVVDLVSRSGTIVASRTTRSAHLDDESILQVGRRRIRVRRIPLNVDQTDDPFEATPPRSLRLPALRNQKPVPVTSAESISDRDWTIILPILEQIAESVRISSAQSHQALAISERILGLLGPGAGAGPAAAADLAQLRDQADQLRRQIESMPQGNQPANPDPVLPRPMDRPAPANSDNPPPFVDPRLHHLIQERLETLGDLDSGFWARLFRRG